MQPPGALAQIEQGGSLMNRRGRRDRCFANWGPLTAQAAKQTDDRRQSGRRWASLGTNHRSLQGRLRTQARTATPAINRRKRRHPATLSEFGASCLNELQRSVNRKVQGSNPWSGANCKFENRSDTEPWTRVCSNRVATAVATGRRVPTAHVDTHRHSTPNASLHTCIFRTDGTSAREEAPATTLGTKRYFQPELSTGRHPGHFERRECDVVLGELQQRGRNLVVRGCGLECGCQQRRNPHYRPHVSRLWRV